MERKQYIDQIKELVQTARHFWMPILPWVISRRSKRQSQTVRLPVCRSRLTSLLENCKPVGVICMARTMIGFL